MKITIGTPSQFSPEKILTRANIEKGDYFVQAHDPTLVGSLFVKKYKESYILRGVYVDPTHRNKGIATLMLKTILDHLEKKHKPVFLYVDHENARAISVYTKLGFTFVKRGFAGDKYEYQFTQNIVS